jgi:hypothetical protein
MSPYNFMITCIFFRCYGFNAAAGIYEMASGHQVDPNQPQVAACGFMW